jgi:cytochrome c biogenesis protein ResB
MGRAMADTIVSRLAEPQFVQADGKRFSFALRPARSYKPYSVTLLKATHTTYPGTASASDPRGIPKDFRSRVRIDNPQKGENREVEIFMNSPLRYGGLTFYQYQMNAGCAIVATGLIVQFMIHLVGFVSRKRTA